MVYDFSLHERKGRTVIDTAKETRAGSAINRPAVLPVSRGITSEHSLKHEPVAAAMEKQAPRL